jgi:uncharacterized RDD family membrane protein YckC
MKCPKCGYLGFEDVKRCRNCGYDFSLNAPPAVPDLTIRRDTRALTPLDDLALSDSGGATDRPRLTDIGADLDRMFGVQPPPVTAVAPPAAVPAAPRAAVQPSETAHPRTTAAAVAASDASNAELPLFGSSISDEDDEPLITRPSPPRAPLAVRRATPELPKLRAETPRAAVFDLTLDETTASTAMRPERTGASWDDPDATGDAGVAARCVAVVIDLLILAVIDAVVIYFTTRICGLTLDDLGILPKGPLVAFLLVQNGGYLVAFTAGGQTLGKMATGIRVVPADADARLDLGRAFLRTLMWVLLAIPAGLGFLTAVLSRDRRGLHDRFAGTRVVRASA